MNKLFLPLFALLIISVSFQNCGVFAVNQSKRFSTFDSVNILNDTDSEQPDAHGIPLQQMIDDVGVRDQTQIDWGNEDPEIDLTSDNGDTNSQNNHQSQDQGQGLYQQPNTPIVLNTDDGTKTSPLRPEPEVIVIDDSKIKNVVENLDNSNNSFNFYVDGIGKLGLPVQTHKNTPKQPIDQLNIERLCSNNYSTISAQNVRRPLSLSTQLHFVIYSADTQNILCERTDTQVLREEILNQGIIDLASCQNTIQPPFDMALFNEDGDNLFNVVSANALKEKKSVTITSKGARVLIADNGKSKAHFGGILDEALYKKCDKNQSPLFVDLRDFSESKNGFTLSAPWNGVLFDIMGLKAQPKAYTKQRISWFRSDKLAFLVLPTVYGEVKGIDQLFGDNTAGPDGKFASNGFLALAKYDGIPLSKNTQIRHLASNWYRLSRNPDGLIDKNDDVYHRLKLWKDKNANAIVDDGELISLNDAGIEAIDLNYDPNFYEEDKYGNQVKYKSIVKMSNGDYRLIFDLWFKTYSP